MFDFSDFLNRSGGADAMGMLTRQFKLTPDQTRMMVEAMVPAIAATLQRQMDDPKALANWAAMLSGKPAGALGFGMPSAVNDMQTSGAAAIGTVFGSPEVADAVTRQVAATTGLGQAVTNAMLPLVAAMTVSGLAVANAKPGTDLSDLAKTLQPVTSKLPNPAGPQSLIDASIGEFIRGFNRGRPEPEPEPQKTDLEVMLDQMVEAGRQAQATNQKAIEEILDRMMGRKS